MDYSEYLQITPLLDLQKPVSQYNKEELIFIVTHQASELWLKILLLELDKLKTLFKNRQTLEIIAQIEQCILFMNMIIKQFQALEGLSFIEFSRFRTVLGQSSGVQSIQFKVLNHILGLFKLSDIDRETIKQYPHLSGLIDEPPLNTIIQNYITTILGINEDNNTQLKKLYETSVETQLIFDKMIQFDEAYIKWKRMHVNIVKRMIGNKLGTGMTSMQYLIDRIEKPIFIQLWQLRDEL